MQCSVLNLTMVGHKHKKCSHLNGHKNKCVMIHRNKICIPHHSGSLVADLGHENTCQLPTSQATNQANRS